MKTIAITFATASLLFCALAPEIADANTIENFSFTQAGYAGTEMATGTFTGIPELHGSIQLADLTAFSISYMALIGRPNVTETDTYTLPVLKLFSFRPAADGPNSSLDLFASITTGT